MIDQIKKWWSLIAVIFILGGSWATANYKVKELERRIDKLEREIEDMDFKALRADVKTLTRESWRRTR